MESLRIDLAADPSAAAAARRAVAALDWLPSERRDDVILMVSELATNAVRHGRHRDGRFALRVAADHGVLRVEVEDAGAGWRRPGAAGSRSLGLRLVAELSDHWGVRTDRGTVVWFEVEMRR